MKREREEIDITENCSGYKSHEIFHQICKYKFHSREKINIISILLP